MSLKEKRIKKYHAQGWSIRKIAIHLNLSRYEVAKNVNPGNESKKGRNEIYSILEPHREEILSWTNDHKIPAKIIHKRIAEKGIDISYPSVTRYLKTLRKPEVYVPVVTAPGEEGQVDFGYLGLFNKGGKKIKVWVFNMVLSYSRYAFYKIVTDQTVPTFLNCHADAFEFFKGVPGCIKIDNLGAGVLEADFYEPSIQKRYEEFLSYYGATCVTARICRGQDKGKVEAGIKYVKTSFLKRIDHTEFDKLSGDLFQWIKTKCNLRVHGTTKKIPQDQYLKIEKAALISLPDERYKPVEFEERKVNSYGHVYFRKNHYSVPHHYAGETVLLESNGTTVKIFKDEKLLAIHVICNEAGQFITIEQHKPFHKRLRTEAWYLEQSGQIGEHVIRIMTLMQSERPFHWKQMMKGIFALTKAYSNAQINKACEMAVLSAVCTYKKVRLNCEKYRHQQEQPKTIRGVNGYCRDLSIYDQLISQPNFTE